MGEKFVLASGYRIANNRSPSSHPRLSFLLLVYHLVKKKSQETSIGLRIAPISVKFKSPCEETFREYSETIPIECQTKSQKLASQITLWLRLKVFQYPQQACDQPEYNGITSWAASLIGPISPIAIGAFVNTNFAPLFFRLAVCPCGELKLSSKRLR